MQVRRFFVGTYFGYLLHRSRYLWSLRRFLGNNTEQGGTFTNDAIAEIILPRLCHPTEVFIDCGSHIGSVIASVERYNPKVKIFAFEAVPEKSAWLTKRFPNVSVLNLALADSECEATFYVDSNRSGYSSLIRRDGSKSVPITVQMKRLDDIIPSQLDVGTIKIDVEGAEFRVLSGASKLIDRCRPTIMFESAQNDEPKIHNIFDWFNKRDYGVFVPNRVAHHGPALTREGFVEAHHYPRRSTNYFAIHSEQRDEIRKRAREALAIRVS